MALRGNFPGILIVVLCHSAAQIACGDFSADPEPGEANDGSGGNGDGDGTGSGGEATGGQPSGSGGVIVEYFPECPNDPTAIVTITGAPIEGYECLVSLEIHNPTEENDPPVGQTKTCMPQGENCICTVWDGLLSSVTTIRVLDEGGQVNAEYSGNYLPLPIVFGRCLDPPRIQIAYTPPANSPVEPTSCIVSGVEEFCAPGEGCCSCGCGIVTDACLQEDICPPHEGPTCGDGNCRAGKFCCDADEGTCAASEADCPVIAL